MPKYSESVYYSPEAFGLSVIATEREPDLSYQFNIFSIWQDNETGRYFFGSDRGCSCPTPFEKVEHKSQLPEGTLEDAKRALQTWRDSWEESRRQREAWLNEV